MKTKKGRPKGTETKTEFLILRVTPAQHEKFRQIAQAKNTTMSSLIISKVLN